MHAPGAGAAAPAPGRRARFVGRRSLRTKAYLLLAPSTAVVGLLAWSAVSPYRGIGREIDAIRTTTVNSVAAQRFMTAVAQEADAYTELALPPEAGAAPDVAGARRTTDEALATWRKLADEGNGDRVLTQTLARVEDALRRLRVASRDVEDLVGQGRRQEAAARIEIEVEPLVDGTLALEVDGFIQARQGRLVESLFRLVGVLDRAAAPGLSGPTVDTAEVIQALTLASLPETFARAVVTEVREDAHALLTGSEVDVQQLTAAHQTAQGNLQALRGFGQGGQTQLDSGTAARLDRLTEALTSLHALGEESLADAKTGRTDEAAGRIVGELRPLLVASIVEPAQALSRDGEERLLSVLAEVDHGVGRTALELQLLVALAALAAVGIPIVVSHRLVRPLVALQDAAGAVGAGDLEARAEAPGGGEVQDLIEAFNAMVTDLKVSRQASRAAQDEAERANQAKNEFLSRMSHELRTPLNAILGFGQLLESDPDLGTDQREEVDQILKGGRHLLDLINEVLDIARIEGGEMALSLEPVGVADVATEVLDLLRPLAASHTVELPVEGTLPTALHVRADRQRLKQVLLNLVANAIKYNRPGGAVTLSCELAGPDRARLRVVDTGLGIPPDKLDRLFTPFDRLGAEQSEVTGTGLGLALAQRLVEAMGGALGVETEAGTGSTFWVELPTAEAPEDRVRPAALAHLPGPKPDAGARTILYIEDNLSNLRLVEQILTRRPQVNLLAAMQGSLGLMLAHEHRPDLILLDLNLPDLPGVDVLARLRQAPETRDTPIVVISADATPGQIERLIASGATSYLTKPFDLARFFEVVDTILA